jgi:RNA polymerase sigma-70 factor, ECF subfamily
LSPDKQLIESALLVVRWQRGDREAFAEIVKLWERSLFFYLRRLAPTEADAWELLQETWLKLLRSLHKLRDPRTLPAYLYTTARHAAISRFRVKPPEVESYPEQLADNRSNDDVAAFEDAEQLRYALDQLPVHQREILTLFFLDDLTLEELSTLLEIPVGTVKSRLHYAKAALRAILSKGASHVR